jgi:malate dehydrogenase (oxaloacetate-decarboxylating)
VRGHDYDEFIETFVTAVLDRWPDALLQWEDFARANAGRLLDRYRDRLCTFNDDIQGTASVAVGALLAALKITDQPIAEQRVAIVGAGSAGCGIAALILRVMMDAGLSEADARRRFYAVDRDGLLVAGGAGILDFQRPFAQPSATVSAWRLERAGACGLVDVMVNAKPTVVFGASGQPGAFGERAVRAMAANVARPIVFPLSNPTSRSEATPQDLMAWTDGRAIIGTGSPFPPIERNGKPFTVDQTNNAYVFPGVGLGVLAVKARRVTDGMFAAAARALAVASPAARDSDAKLLPDVDDLRSVAVAVARAVALQARTEGLCEPYDEAALDGLIARKMWEPVYRPYRPNRSGAAAAPPSGAAGPRPVAAKQRLPLQDLGQYPSVHRRSRLDAEEAHDRRRHVDVVHQRHRLAAPDVRPGR